MTRFAVKHKSRASIVVNDETEKEFLEDLCKKSRLAAGNIINNDLNNGTVYLMASALISAYIKELGMLEAAAEDSSQAYFVRTLVAIDVLRSVLEEAGVSIKADVLPRSEAQKKYEQLLKND